MPSLREQLSAPDNAPRVVEACCTLVETEVQSKRGVAGIAVKTGYSVVRKVSPNMVRDVITRLLPTFADALDPMYQRVAAGSNSPGSAFRSELEANADEAANALLGVTDRRIEVSQPLIRKTYAKLRKGALGHVRVAMPGLGRSLEPLLG